MRAAASWFFSWCAILVAVAACASASVPVHNFSGVPLGAKSSPGLEQIGKTIVQAGSSAGWQMSEVKPGHIIGTYRIRRHLAVVDVTYNTAAYNITFQHGDPGLKYDGQTIHQNYNTWVEELERVIRAHLSAL
jgi:hypothetical protein